jgi:hypothetical protein
MDPDGLLPISVAIFWAYPTRNSRDP